MAFMPISFHLFAWECVRLPKEIAQLRNNLSLSIIKELSGSKGILGVSNKRSQRSPRGRKPGSLNTKGHKM